MITFTATGRSAAYTADDLLTSGSVGIPMTLELSSDFDGLSCVAVFRGSGVTVDVALTGSTCTVPHEVLANACGVLEIGIYARDAAGTVVIPTIWAAGLPIQTGAVPSGVDPSEPTPDWTAQVQQMATEALETAISVRADADAGEFDGPPGPVGPQGEIGPTPDISIGTVATLPAGSDATASMTGTPEDPVLNLGIPKGDPGEVTQEEFDALSAEVADLSVEKTTSGDGEVFLLSDVDLTDVEVSGSAASLTVRNTQIFEGKYPGQSSVVYGVTITKNDDDSYTINGTATSSAWYFFNQSTRVGQDNLLDFIGQYSLRLDVLGGSVEKNTSASSTLYLYGVRPASSGTLILGNGVDDAAMKTAIRTEELNAEDCVIGIRLTNGVKYTNYRLRFMVNKGEPLPWTKYMAPTVVQDLTSDIAGTANAYLPNLWMYTDDPSSVITVKQLFSPVDYIDENVKILNDKISAVADSVGGYLISVNHRGYHSGYPENTLWAFAQSKIRGFAWIETDVRFTSDGVGVLLHDESINRTARNADGTELSSTVNIADITYEQALEYDFGIYAGAEFAGTKIVTAEECISFCKSVGLSILMEVKVAGSGTYCANLVKRYAMEDNVIWISFGTPQLQEVNAVLPNAMIGLVTTQQPSASHVTTAESLKTDYNKVFLDFGYTYSIIGIRDSMISADIGYGVYTLNYAPALQSLDPYCFMITSDTLVAGKRMAQDALSEWT